MDYHFSFLHISEKHKKFTEKQKHFAREIFTSSHTSNRIYIYLKDMYITLKEIGEIFFVSVLRILLICKFLNFIAVFTKKEKKNFVKFAL